jgi:hypothetical protein
MSKKNRRNKPPEPLNYSEFTRELTKAVEGDPSADESVRAFWDDTSQALGIKAALMHPKGVEVLRNDEEGGAR